MTGDPKLGELDHVLLAAAMATALPGSAERAWTVFVERLGGPGGLVRLAAERQDLLGMLYRTALAIDAEGPLPARLAGAQRRIWSANQLRIVRVADVGEALSSVGVAYVVADDLAVITAAYGDLMSRPLQRLRLILNPEDLPRAAEMLSQSGWHPRRPPPGGYVADHDARLWEDDHGERIELAGSLGGDLSAPPSGGTSFPYASDDAAELWATSEPLEPAIGLGRRLGTAHQLVRLAAEGSGWRPQPRLLRVADIALLAGSATDRDWEGFVALARRRRLTRAISVRLDWVARVLPGALPPATLTELRAAPRDWRETAVARLDPVSPALARHLRGTTGERLPTLLARLPASLRESWSLPTAWQIPAVAASRVRRRVTRSND